MNLCTHYSLATNPPEMFRWATQATTDLMNVLSTDFSDKRPLLCFTGYSGISHATAISLTMASRNIEHGTIYVRKDNEVSHGTKLEFRLSKNVLSFSSSKNKDVFNIKLLKTYHLVFVDDLIESGDTKRKVFDKIRNKCSNSILKDDIRLRSCFITNLLSDRLVFYRENTFGDPEPFKRFDYDHSTNEE